MVLKHETAKARKKTFMIAFVNLQIHQIHDNVYTLVQLGAVGWISEGRTIFFCYSADGYTITCVAGLP